MRLEVKTIAHFTKRSDKGRFKESWQVYGNFLEDTISGVTPSQSSV